MDLFVFKCTVVVIEHIEKIQQAFPWNNLDDHEKTMIGYNVVCKPI